MKENSTKGYLLSSTADTAKLCIPNSVGSGSTSGPLNFETTGSTTTISVGYVTNLGNVTLTTYKKEIGEDGSTDLDALFENAQKFRYQNCLEEVRRIRELINIIKNNNTIVKEVEVPYQPKPDNMPHRKKWSTGKIYRPAIYFLFDGDEIVYIGQSINPYSRITQHIKKKKFSHVRFLPCSSRRMNYWEQKLISKYNPKYNVTHNKRYNVTSLSSYRKKR